MFIDPNQFQIEDNFWSQHNNKVGTLNVSYTLCRHYYDKGIPDDPWYISPGRDGQSIEDIYKEANLYRTKIVHGATPNDVSSGVSILRNVETEVTDINEDGDIVTKKTKVKFQFSDSFEEYIDTKTIMDNIDNFSIFAGNKIDSIRLKP